MSSYMCISHRTRNNTMVSRRVQQLLRVKVGNGERSHSFWAPKLFFAAFSISSLAVEVSSFVGQGLNIGPNQKFQIHPLFFSEIQQSPSNGKASTWQDELGESLNLYRSTTLFSDDVDWQDFLQDCQEKTSPSSPIDPFWEQTKLEALAALEEEPEAGPQLYQGILSHPNLLEAICTVISHEIETELIPATAIKKLFLETLTSDDEVKIRTDLHAVATRCPSVGNAMDGALFHNGFHALVCYRLGHRLWKTGRTDLATYMQSTVSRTYSADIHPACSMGSGIYVRVGGGVVIGETAIVGNDVSILEGVTLGGTGKEAGDRHPKVGNGVVIQDGGTVLGNIPVGDGSVITAKSIVTKPVPPLAIVSGVPAKITGFRDMEEASCEDDLEHHLVDKYYDQWREIDTSSSQS